MDDGGLGTDTSTDIGALLANPGADIPGYANGVLAVDLGALARNYRKLRDMTGPAECAGVVKANGYGLGVAQVAPALYAEGCRTFFVATFGEAVDLRALLPDVTIYALNGMLPGAGGGFVRENVRPVLGSMAEVAEWAAFCRAEGMRLPAAIQIDTGMNRLGVKANDCRALGQAGLSDFPVSLVMSHLACGDELHAKNAAQRDAFCAAAAYLPKAPRSLAASGGILLGPDFHFDLVRPGIALYGGNPFAGRPNQMEPVMRLYGRIAGIGEAQAGETVGYGAGRTLTRRTRYATVCVGYADGYFRTFGSSDAREGACAHVGAHRMPILGRVSMDLLVFDATDVPDEALARGGLAELIGPHFTLDEAATCAGTISYEVLTSLGPRYHRIYIDGKSGD